MKTLADLLKEHPFFEGIATQDIEFIAGCGQNTVFEPNTIIAAEGDKADTFYLIRQGQVNINTSIPNKDKQTLQTLTDGDILGWSWLFPPYLWIFEAQAKTQCHMVALNGQCLREKCEHEPQLGFQLMKRFAQLMIARLHATRLQLLDVYGKT